LTAALLVELLENAGVSVDDLDGALQHLDGLGYTPLDFFRARHQLRHPDKITPKPRRKL